MHTIKQKGKTKLFFTKAYGFSVGYYDQEAKRNKAIDFGLDKKKAEKEYKKRTIITTLE